MLKNSRSKINYYFRKYFIIPLKIFRKSVIDTINHDGIEHAGYLAFLSILSFFPSLIFLIAVIGLFGESKIGTDFLHELVSSLPNEMSRGLTPRINEIISGPSDGYLTIAIIGVIWTASSSVEGCRTILNRAYRVAFPPPYILRRLVSIFEFFIIIFVIISGILIFVIVPVILKYFEKQFSIKLAIDYDFFYLRQLAIFSILTISTSVLYFALPNVKQKIWQTIPGSVLAVILWITLVDFFSLYLENFDQMNFVYGSIA